jgi:hypothetical protein
VRASKLRVCAQIKEYMLVVIIMSEEKVVPIAMEIGWLWVEFGHF